MEVLWTRRRAEPTPPVCIRPLSRLLRKDEWHDDYQGDNCSAYPGCQRLATRAALQSLGGIVCTCTTALGKTILRKIAHEGNECALGDEFRVSRKLKASPCFARALLPPSEASWWAQQPTSGVVRAMRTVSFKLVVHSAASGRHICPGFARPETCDTVRLAMMHGAARLKERDTFKGNILPTFPLGTAGQTSRRSLGICPFVFIDVSHALDRPLRPLRLSPLPLRSAFDAHTHASDVVRALSV